MDYRNTHLLLPAVVTDVGTEMKYIVYGLIDPRTDQLFYIGKSCSGLKQMKRHTQPWSIAHGGAKNERIREIMDAGYEVHFTILASSKRNRKKIEQIERVLIAANKYTLTNKRIG